MNAPQPELAPCPFCSGEARSRDYGRGRIGVQCMNCRATSMLSLPGEDAITAWNTRATNPKVQAMAGILRGFVLNRNELTVKAGSHPAFESALERLLDSAADALAAWDAKP
jgi:hypothetical protein